MGNYTYWKAASLLILAIALLDKCTSAQYAPTTSTGTLSGKHFVFGFPTNKGPLSRDRSMNVQLYSTNSDVTYVNIAAPGIAWSNQVTLNPNQLVTVQAPDEVEASPSGTWQNGTIVVTADRDIYVTALSYALNSFASFPIIPSESAFGYEFFVANYQPAPIYPSEILISGSFADANVVIKTRPDMLCDDLQLPEDFPYNQISNNEIAFSLAPFHSLQLRYTLDFTGLQILSDSPISVLSGGECTYITTYDFDCDHIAAYMPPVDRLGREFTIAPFAGRESGYLYRIVAVRDNTTVIKGSDDGLVLDAGDYYTEDVMYYKQVTTLTSNKPVLVVQFSKGYSSDNKLGDPLMMVVPPREQYGNAISFASSDMTSFSISKNYLNLIIPCGDLDDVMFNGNRFGDHGSDWMDVLEAGDQCVARRELTTYRINHITHTSDDVRFTAFINGAGNGLSYGYPVDHGFSRITCTIRDDENRTREVDCKTKNETKDALIEFSASEVSVHEGQGSISLSLTNAGSSNGRVSFQTADGTAISGVDYASLEGLTIEVPGHGSAEILIEIYEDFIAETTEYFMVYISGDTGDISSTKVNILDYFDPLPTQPGIPGMELICDGTNMTLIFNASALPYTEPSNVHLLDSDCTAFEYGNNQAIISTDYHLCSTIMIETEGHIIFRNSLITGPVDDDSPIERPTINFQCAIERRYMVDTSYLASRKTHTSFGNFTFALDIFEGSNFRYAYRPDDYPVPVKINDDIYLGARVFTVVTLDLFIDSCWATPSPDPWDEVSYSLIRHGCPDEATLQTYDSGNPTVEQFSFRVFKFKGAKWLVYVHCQLLVCDVDTVNSRCDQGCVTVNNSGQGRMRRSDSDLHTQSIGPLVIRG